MKVKIQNLSRNFSTTFGKRLFYRIGGFKTLMQQLVSFGYVQSY